MRTALLALLLVGCATIPDGSITFSADEFLTMSENFAKLQAEVRRLQAQKVPLCNEASWR